MVLTSKRLAFANAIIAGMNPSEAYRAAGYKCDKMGAHSIRTEAYRLTKCPDVSLLIEEGRAEVSERAAWSRETALERLSEVNRISLQSMQETGVTDRDSVSGFMESFDRLQAMTEGDSMRPDAPTKAPTFYFNRTAVNVPTIVLGVEPREMGR